MVRFAARCRIAGILSCIVIAAGLLATAPALAAPRAVLGELFSADN